MLLSLVPRVAQVQAWQDRTQSRAVIKDGDAFNRLEPDISTACPKRDVMYST